MEDVIVGSNDLFGRDGAERIPVDQLLPHPDYNNVTEVNDIMLVKLESPSSAPLVNWNLNEDLPNDGEDVKVIGFGQTSDGGKTINIRAKARSLSCQCVFFFDQSFRHAVLFRVSLNLAAVFLHRNGFARTTRGPAERNRF